MEIGGTLVTGNFSTVTSDDAPGAMQDMRYLFFPSDDCAENAEEEIEDATMMLLLDFTEEESGRLLVDWEDEAGETDEPALHFTWHSCSVPYCFAQTPVHLSVHPVKGKQHHDTTLLTELAALDGGGREEERTLKTAEEGTEDAVELAGEEGGGTEEVDEANETEEGAEEADDAEETDEALLKLPTIHCPP